MRTIEHAELNAFATSGRAVTAENFLTRDDLFPIVTKQHYDRKRWTVAKYGLLHVAISNDTLRWAERRLTEEQRCRRARQA